MSESTLISPFLNNTEDPLLGIRLGDYEVLERVGVGGMGVVYRGVQPVINKRVAIKVLKPEFASDPAQVQRLVTEAQLVNAVAHRNIIDIFGFGQVPDGRHYIVMEFLEGEALDVWMKSRVPMNPLDVVEMLTEICVPLFAAHQAGVIHRDLKPSNIFRVRQADGTVYLKLLDFGLSKRAVSIDGRTAQTSMTQVAGTPDYMAPEQARGKDISPATDLYALGVMTWQMLVGRLPFIGETAMDVMMKQVHETAIAPSRMRSGIPPELDALVLHLMAKEPQDRPSSAEAMRAELKRIGRDLQNEAHEDSTHPSFDRLASTLVETDAEDLVGHGAPPSSSTDAGRTQPLPTLSPDVLAALEAPATPAASPAVPRRSLATGAVARAVTDNRLGADGNSPTTEKASQTRRSQRIILLLAFSVALVGAIAWALTHGRSESVPVVPPPHVDPPPLPVNVKPKPKPTPPVNPPVKPVNVVEVKPPQIEVVKPPPVEVVKPAVDPVRPAPVRQPPPPLDFSEQDLRIKVNQLQRKLKVLTPPGAEVDPTLLRFLNKRAQEAKAANTRAERVKAMQGLESFEKQFLSNQ